MPSISLFKSLSHGDMADSAAPASHLVPRRTYLQIRHPHCPRPKKCRLHLLLQVNLGSQNISIHRFSRNPFVIETGPPN